MFISFEFEKYHGLGNDFIFIKSDLLNQFSSLTQLKIFVKTICQSHTSVGADGVVFYGFDLMQNAQILIINSDGSFAANCGNALRCLGLALFRHHQWNGKNSVTVVRMPFPTHLANLVESNEKYLLQMDTPFAVLYNLKEDQNVFKVTTLYENPVKIENWNEYKVDGLNISAPVFVQLENPHIVFFSKDFMHFNQSDYIQFGKKIQKIFNANISMIYALPVECNSYNLCVYERGAGLTLACGTGAVASTMALQYLGKIESLNKTVTLKMPGGTIKIQNISYQKNLNVQPVDKIALCAEAQFVFSARMRVASA